MSRQVTSFGTFLLTGCVLACSSTEPSPQQADPDGISQSGRAGGTPSATGGGNASIGGRIGVASGGTSPPTGGMSALQGGATNTGGGPTSSAAGGRDSSGTVIGGADHGGRTVDSLIGGAGGAVAVGGAAGGASPGGAGGKGGTGSGGLSSAGGRGAGGASGTAAGQASGGTAGNAVTAVIRVQVNYSATSKQYQFDSAVREQSGTPALIRRAAKIDQLGSFVGTVTEPSTNQIIYQQTIGTGYYYRELVRALTFRFPSRTNPFVFKMTAENATTGTQQEVISTTIDPATLKDVPPMTVELRTVKAAVATPKVIMPIYAEGYLAARKANFFQDAQTIADALNAYGFPAVDRFEMIAVWAPSNQTLGKPGPVGSVPAQDTFLGLSFPVWSDIEGPDVIIYPTDEKRTRNAFAQVPYDYPLVIVDDSGYWGVGNYNMYTAIPAHNSSYRMLLVHEMGHFFGLNEEYNDQITELAFSPGIVDALVSKPDVSDPARAHQMGRPDPDRYCHTHPAFGVDQWQTSRRLQGRVPKRFSKQDPGARWSLSNVDRQRVLPGMPASHRNQGRFRLRLTTME